MWAEKLKAFTTWTLSIVAGTALAAGAAVVVRGHTPTATTAAPTTVAPSVPSAPAPPTQPTSDVRFTDHEAPTTIPVQTPRPSTPTIPPTTVPRWTDERHGDDYDYDSNESEGGWGEDDD